MNRQHFDDNIVSIALEELHESVPETVEEFALTTRTVFRLRHDCPDDARELTAPGWKSWED